MKFLLDLNGLLLSLLDGSLCFGGEESADASFSRLNGSVWTTDKDEKAPGNIAAIGGVKIVTKNG